MRWRAVLVLALGLLPNVWDCNGGTDEVLCEEATAHLARCCPGFSPARVTCVYDDQGCAPRRPVFSVDQSECLRATSCEDLRRLGTCNRVAAWLTLPASADGVCP